MCQLFSCLRRLLPTQCKGVAVERRLADKIASASIDVLSLRPSAEHLQPALTVFTVQSVVNFHNEIRRDLMMPSLTAKMASHLLANIPCTIRQPKRSMNVCYILASLFSSKQRTVVSRDGKPIMWSVCNTLNDRLVFFQNFVKSSKRLSCVV